MRVVSNCNLYEMNKCPIIHLETSMSVCLNYFTKMKRKWALQSFILRHFHNPVWPWMKLALCESPNIRLGFTTWRMYSLCRVDCLYTTYITECPPLCLFSYFMFWGFVLLKTIWHIFYSYSQYHNHAMFDMQKFSHAILNGLTDLSKRFTHWH